MANVRMVETKDITKKNGTTKKIICVYLNGKATDKQKECFKLAGYSYFPAQKDWVELPNGKYACCGYKSAGCWFCDYSDKEYDWYVAKGLAPKREEPKPAATKPATKRVSAKDKALAELAKLSTKKLQALLAQSK